MNEKAVTASFGVAELQMTDQLSDLCRRSDVALYEAKAGGRNKVAAASILRAVSSEEDRREYGRVQMGVAGPVCGSFLLPSSFLAGCA